MEFQVDLLLASLAMIDQWLMREWSRQYPDLSKSGRALFSKTVRSADDLRGLSEVEDKEQPAYPYTLNVITSLGVDSERAGLNKRHMPLVTGRSENSDHVQSTNAIPCRVGVGMTFRSDTLDEVLRICYILSFAAPRIRLQLRNEYGFIFQNSLNIDPELTIPGADMGYPSKHYQFETTFILQTWMTRSMMTGVIREVRFEVVDSGGVSTGLGEFKTLDDLLTRNIRYTDIMDTTSKNYQPEGS